MAGLLDHFSVLLLDMNRTFMFGEDNFGPDQNFHATYQMLDGNSMSKEQVQTSIRSCHDAMSDIYRLPDNFDNFPSVAEVLRQQNHVPEIELTLLERVFAKHEQGEVPLAYAELLRRLSKTHRLGIVSNLWSRKEPWLAEFKRIGIADVFTCAIFSSDSRSVKPSPALFKAAVKSFPPEAKILFVGDNLERDIKPAKSLGLTTAWLTTSETSSPYADYVWPDLLGIETEPHAG
jgi:putative hydrolase of the HAD superfamily/5'-nucleotidase